MRNAERLPPTLKYGVVYRRARAARKETGSEGRKEGFPGLGRASDWYTGRRVLDASLNFGQLDRGMDLRDRATCDFSVDGGGGSAKGPRRDEGGVETLFERVTR